MTDSPRTGFTEHTEHDFFTDPGCSKCVCLDVDLDDLYAPEFVAPDQDVRSAVLFIESLIPDAGGIDDDGTAEILELWMIAELDAATDALVDGAEVFTLGELVRSTPTPKTAALPGLVMVHYERRVDWTEPAGEDFTIEDAATDDDEAGLDWETIPRSEYVDDFPVFDDDLAGYTPEELADRDAILALTAKCECRGCDDERAERPAFDADEGDLCGPDAEPLFDPAGEYPLNVHTCQACRDEIAAEEPAACECAACAEGGICTTPKP